MTTRQGTVPYLRAIDNRPLAAINRPLFGRRMSAMYVVLVLLLVALVGRLAMIQLVEGRHYAAISVRQVRTEVSVSPLRGGIFDRHGQILAISSPTSLVVADDMQIDHPVTEARALAPFLGVSASTLATQLSHKHDGYVVLSDHLAINKGHKLAAQYFPGIVVLSSSVRSDPNGTIATALLGGVNAAGTGSAGLEYQYQSLLAGQAGRERIFASPSGVSLPNSKPTVLKRAVPGVGIELTIDTSLQFVTEQALAEQLRAMGGLSGTAIVMDVKTGEVLADASLVNTKVPAGTLGPIPSWRTSIGVPGVAQTINNLAVSQVYEPGSVFKIVPFSAALDAGLSTPTTKYTVPYSVSVGGRYFHDAERHGTERLTMTDVLAQSSNIGTYMISRHVGEAGLLAQVERLGFGQQTALNFPGESAGLLVNAAQWWPSDLAALPIGQVDAVTPLQILDAYNAIANHGVFVEPKLVRGYVLASGAMRATARSASHRALSASVSATLTKMLEQVVLAGTGVKAVVPGYAVAGKTGTSQIPSPDHRSYIPGAYNASFVGFAPANNPVLSMIVLVQRPSAVIFGGSVSAPVFQRVMSYALHHYGIPSSGPVAPVHHGGASISSDVT